MQWSSALTGDQSFPRRCRQGLLPHPSLLEDCQIRSLVKDVKSHTVLIVQRQLSLELLPDVLHLVCLKRGKVDDCVQLYGRWLAFRCKNAVANKSRRFQTAVLLCQSDQVDVKGKFKKYARHERQGRHQQPVWTPEVLHERACAPLLASSSAARAIGESFLICVFRHSDPKSSTVTQRRSTLQARSTANPGITPRKETLH